jgi:1-deoxy-D-xylulose-5-phosphate synthase
MILERVNSPADIKQLTLEELTDLCAEVRTLMVDTVSKRGGHLASSLGAVELIAALHCCLDMPRDKIIFDVGHQAYAHKILTGRKDRFQTLRTRGGLSGFPNPAESPFDVFISGHASTAISWAQGIAEGAKLQNENFHVVAMVGDGSLTGGMCFEALNHCGHCSSDILVVYNHNEMSISSSVGALSRYFNKLISAPAYNRARAELQRFLEKHSLAKKVARHAKRFEEALKGLMVPGIFFEELGFRYFGPIDGHNIDLLNQTFKNILPLKGPKVLHVVTKKGKGYKFAEADCEKFHGTVPFHIDTGEGVGPNELSFGDTMAVKLAKLAESNDKIVAVTAAMPHGTGLNIFGEKFPQRLFDVGIAEEHAVGFSAGLARQGLRPVVAVYSTFLQRAFDQIIHDVALQKLPVTFALDRAGAVGEDGPTHHGVFDVGYLRMIPNMVCMAPKDKDELESMLEFALSADCPVSLRYPRGTAYSLGITAPVVMGKAQTIYEGKDICIIALGTMVKPAMECCDILKQNGISAALINARFIKPLDEALLRRAAEDFEFIVTIEDGSLSGGFGSAVLEFFERENLFGKAKLFSLGFKDEFLPAATRLELFEMYGLNPAGLAGQIENIFKKKLKAIKL